MAQTPANTGQLQLNFSAIYAGDTLRMDEESIVHSEEGVNEFRCYLSQFELWKSGHLLAELEVAPMLLDVRRPSSLQRMLDIDSTLIFDAIRYHIGIDSLTSCSGAFGGELDPTLGMFWTWQSGYVHFKLEGLHPISSAVDHSYAYHLGGYLPPVAVFPAVEHRFEHGTTIDIGIHLDQFLLQSELEFLPLVMSPGSDAHRLAQRIPLIFQAPDAP